MSSSEYIPMPPEVAEYLAQPENAGCAWVPTRRLEEKGRCCGRKPLKYRRESHLFCRRCCASFDYEGNQIENWAYSRTIGGWIKFRHHVTSHKRPPAPVTVA